MTEEVTLNLNIVVLQRAMSVAIDLDWSLDKLIQYALVITHGMEGLPLDNIYGSPTDEPNANPSRASSGGGGVEL